jgi:hypothetical protein
MAVSFIGGANRAQYPDKTTDLPQVMANFIT